MPTRSFPPMIPIEPGDLVPSGHAALSQPEGRNVEEIKVHTAHFLSVRRSSPDQGGRQGEPQREGDAPGHREAPADHPTEASAGLADAGVRVEPLVDAEGRVTSVRIYDTVSGEYRGEMSPEELKQFAAQHNLYLGVLVERRL
jgi:hypothetical protein